MSSIAPERAVPSTSPSVDWLIPGFACRITSAVKRGGVMRAPAVARWKASNEATCWDTQCSDDLTQPIVCVPLVVQNRAIGAIAVYGLLAQKDGFSALDHELFNMLGGHAATAIFAARLYSQSERKLNTIQGFIDLLTK